MLYPFVEALIAANNLLDDSLASLGYRLVPGSDTVFGDTGMTFNLEGIGVIGIMALDPSSDLFAVLACYEREMERWHKGDTFRSTRFRSVIVGKKPNPYPPDEPRNEAWYADLYANPHWHGTEGIGSFCSLRFV